MMSDFQKFNYALKELKIKAELVETDRKNDVLRFMLRLDPSTRLNKITACATELALIMQSYGKPTITPITDQGLVCLDFIMSKQEQVLFDRLKKPLNSANQILPLAIGRSYLGEDLILDLVDMPHLLIAGSTGSGKSVQLHSILASLVGNDSTNLKLVLIDPKAVELDYYENIKQLSGKIINNHRVALDKISDLVDTMNHRFNLMKKAKVNNIVEYNKKAYKEFPYIVLVIDEFADLMNGSTKKEFQKTLTTLAQKCRACGIHIIIATQRPEVKVITGTIKANFPARISFRVPSAIDSRIILDKGGAELLMGAGDGILNTPSHNFVRFKGSFISTKEVEDLVEQNQMGLLNRLWSLR